MKTTEPTIAVIGLGIMGGPIAQRLRARYQSVRGLDPSPEAQQAAQAQGIHMASTVAECVADADIVFTALPTVQITQAVMADLLRHGRRGAIWIELGTIGSAAARAHAQQCEAAGLAYLDAPVINGGQQAAQAGTLKVLAGGHAEVLAAVEPVLRAFSTETLHMGPAGAAQTMKLINNMLLAAISSASAEALALAERSGIGAARAFEVLRVSSTRSFALDWLYPPAVRGDFSGGAKIDILVKDMQLVEAEARLHQASVPITQATAALFDQCQAQGWGGSDMSVVLRLLSERST